MNRLLFKLALWLDKKYKHRYPNFCALIDEFYVKMGYWK